MTLKELIDSVSRLKIWKIISEHGRPGLDVPHAGSRKQFVSIADPFFGDSEIDYTQFASPQGGYRDGRGVWFASFLVNNEAAGH